jgi:hypothetical protein
VVEQEGHSKYQPESADPSFIKRAEAGILSRQSPQEHTLGIHASIPLNKRLIILVILVNSA